MPASAQPSSWTWICTATRSTGRCGPWLPRFRTGRPAATGSWRGSCGDPGLAQEVGASNARNRLCIVVPCHRVVGADGKLTGHAGGLARKRALLELEAAAEPVTGFSDVGVSRSGCRGRIPGVSLRPFEQIVADYGPMVLRVCRAVVGPDEAEDAWSETFLAALKAYPRLDEGANVEAWLVTIAHRKAIDAVRAAARAAAGGRVAARAAGRRG